jgi:hypothetical protein
MYAPDTSFDSSSPIFGPDSQFPTDSPMDWKSTTPPAPIPVVRAFTPFDAPPTPYGAPPTPNARPLSPFVPPVQPPAFVFDPDNPYYAPTPQPVPPTEWPSTPHRAPTSQPFPPSEWPSTPQDAPPPPPIVPLENAPAPNRAPTPPPSQGIQPQIGGHCSTIHPTCSFSIHRLTTPDPPGRLHQSVPIIWRSTNKRFGRESLIDHLPRDAPLGVSILMKWMIVLSLHPIDR